MKSLKRSVSMGTYECRLTLSPSISFSFSRRFFFTTFHYPLLITPSSRPLDQRNITLQLLQLCKQFERKKFSSSFSSLVNCSLAYELETPAYLNQFDILVCICLVISKLQSHSSYCRDWPLTRPPKHIIHLSCLSSPQLLYMNKLSLMFVLTRSLSTNNFMLNELLRLLDGFKKFSYCSNMFLSNKVNFRFQLVGTRIRYSPNSLIFSHPHRQSSSLFQWSFCLQLFSKLA